MRISDWSSDVCSSDLLLKPKPSAFSSACALVSVCGACAASTNAVSSAISALMAARTACASFAAFVLSSSAGAGVGASASSSASLASSSRRSEEHTSELQSLMRISYAVFCLQKKNENQHGRNKE